MGIDGLEMVEHKFSIPDRSSPGSSVHGILQARILEWVSIAFSRDFHDPGLKPRPPALQADSLPSEPPGECDRKRTLNKKILVMF